MAREYGKAWFAMFTDEHFTSQPNMDKFLYMALLGQPSLNYAGITPINLKRWRKAIREGDRLPSELEIKAALIRLERNDYVFSDDDTGEVLVRSFIRRDQICKQPNVLVSALTSSAQIESPKLARVLLSELGRIELPEVRGDGKLAQKLRAALPRLMAAAVAHLEGLSEGLSKPFSEPFREDFPEGLSEGFSRPGETEGLREPFREGLSKPSVVVEVEVAKSPSPDGYVGRGAPDELESGQPSNDPPNPRCLKHLNDPTDKPCRACGSAREARQAWDADQKRIDAQRRSEAVKADALLRAHETAECSLCDEDGYRNALPCSHDPHEDERRERGSAMVRAILAKGKTA